MGRLDPAPVDRYPLGMARQPKDILAATTDVAQAAQGPAIIDADEFDREALDRRWQQFCRDADRYVAESTRPLARSSQRASL